MVSCLLFSAAESALTRTYIRAPYVIVRYQLGSMTESSCLTIHTNADQRYYNLGKQRVYFCDAACAGSLLVYAPPSGAAA
jgi:hypothetical protein